MSVKATKLTIQCNVIYIFKFNTEKNTLTQMKNTVEKLYGTKILFAVPVSLNIDVSALDVSPPFLDMP